MDKLSAFVAQLPGIKPIDIVDILVVALLFYILLPVLRSTGTTKIAWVAAVVVAVASIASLLELHTLSFILSKLLSVGLLALVILFQPELRRALDHMSKLKLKGLFGGVQKAGVPVTVAGEGKGDNDGFGAGEGAQLQVGQRFVIAGGNGVRAVEDGHTMAFQISGKAHVLIPEDNKIGRGR